MSKSNPADLPDIEIPDGPAELEPGADPRDGYDGRGLLRRRPAETTTGVVLLASVYGALLELGVADALAAVLAVLVAFVPGGISYVVDAARGS